MCRLGLPVAARRSERVYGGRLCGDLLLCVGVDMLEFQRGPLVGDNRRQGLCHPEIVLLLLGQFISLTDFHLSICPRRTKVRVGMAAVVVIPLIFRPARIVPVVPAVVNVCRVIPRMILFDFISRKDADTEIGVIVVVTEVVMVVTRIGKQVGYQRT